MWPVENFLAGPARKNIELQRTAHYKNFLERASAGGPCRFATPPFVTLITNFENTCAFEGLILFGVLITTAG